MASVTETSSLEKSKSSDGTKMINSFEVIKALGKGAFGKVKLCKDTHDGQLYAIKIMDKTVLKKKRQGMSNMLESVKKEIAIMKKLSHANVVRLFEVIDDPSQSKLYLRLEYVEGGQCMPSANGTKPLSVATAQRYFVDLVNGLEYLHHNHILHRDLKPENLLVDKEGRLKLADFGVSQHFGGDDDEADVISKSAGTPAFMAPECCTPGAFHGRVADLWSAGVSLYFFVHGKCPFVCPNVIQLYDMIKQDAITFDESLPAELLDLLRKMLDKDPAARIGIPDIKLHPFYTAACTTPQTMGAQVKVTEQEIRSALTLSEQVVLMVRINKMMKTRLASARDVIAQRSDAPPSARAAPPSHIPDGMEVLHDSDEEKDDKGKKKKGMCGQQ
eukprot:CAMPEP_0202818798 /NCGR_PEP_ID=MMETSP1389-20130828/8611_1 /ASSEMBLY_ACC=CAM_ASM_000865 /TAXON_ID=302021 /ORGANISM="Rhodomonas sp., Strain CCMP768" /LENGTH=386 /DNA_ID=CAMNT_0049491223 /DNA_START=104 /DNA_END=1264 /DNA_ORIENTATION=+